MRILAIEYCVTTTRGGSERSYFDVLTGLQAAGHQVYLIYNEEGNLLKAYEDAGVKTFKRSTPFIMRSGSKRKDFAGLWNVVSSLKEMGRFDVVYINFAESIPLAALIRLRLGTPVVCHLRVGYSGLTRQILWASRLVSAFIVVNKSHTTEFENKLKAHGKVSVIYNGIGIPATFIPSKKRNPGDHLRILYIGRIALDKGVLDLVNSFSSAVRQGVRAQLQITGSFVASYLGDFKGELSDAIARSGVSELITVSSAVDNPIEYISKFDLLIFPSIADESFGRTIPESIVAGTPVLARDLGMVKEIMVDSPHFVFESNEMLTEKMIEFYHGRLSFDIESARQTMDKKFNKTRMISEVEKKLIDVVAR